MKKILLFLFLLHNLLLASSFIELPSRYDLDTTVEIITKNITQHKAFSIFTIIDHSHNAKKVGLKMPQTKLIIFGNPKAGTKLMLANPFMAYELPLKILISHKRGRTIITYRDPQWLANQYQLYNHPIIPKMKKVMQSFVASCL